MIDFVGAGPGAPDLITVRGKGLLEKADIIIYTGSLVNPELLKYAKEDCKIYDSSGMTFQEIMDIMLKCDREGKRVVRLHTGDPALYGAIGEQFSALKEDGVDFNYCPGVSSLFGAASALKKEFTLPGVSQTLIISRMEGRTKVPDKENIRSLASHHASMALFLSTGMAEKVSEELIKGGYEEDCPAAIVYKATWEDEEVIFATLKDLPDIARERGIDKTAIILAGDFLREEGERSKLYDPGFRTGFRDAGDK